MATQSQPVSDSPTATRLAARQVYMIAAVCLLVGFVVGYALLARPVTLTATLPQPSTPSAAKMGIHPKLTLEQMEQMADVKASALVEKSKAEPKNVKLLIQIAATYQASHQFKQAADYFARALKLEPKDTPARTELAACLFYSGDTDRAIKELNAVLRSKPSDVNALFDLGMIKYRGKHDNAGATAAWEQLLKTNPDLDRRPIVERLIAEAKSVPAPQN
jgi:cytochrome c-type biogenesis protein CcmH/NrfG